MLVFPDHDAPVIRTESTPHSILVPLVKELASILEVNCTIEELQEYKGMLSSAKTKTKKIKLRNAHHRTTASTEKMVSSSVRSNKKLKSHGTKHMTSH